MAEYNTARLFYPPFWSVKRKNGENCRRSLPRITTNEQGGRAWILFSAGSAAPSADLVLRLLVEQCRDRTVPRARTQRKEGSIRALVWSYCSRALSSGQGMNIERSNPGWPELFRPSPPSLVLVSSTPFLSFPLCFSSGARFLTAAEALPFTIASTKSRSRVNTHPLASSLNYITARWQYWQWSRARLILLAPTRLFIARSLVRRFNRPRCVTRRLLAPRSLCDPYNRYRRKWFSLLSRGPSTSIFFFYFDPSNTFRQIDGHGIARLVRREYSAKRDTCRYVG